MFKIYHRNSPFFVLTLETFLIASSSKTPILIKVKNKNIILKSGKILKYLIFQRFTLKNENSLRVKTTFFGVAAGTVQIEVMQYILLYSTNFICLVWQLAQFK